MRMFCTSGPVDKKTCYYVERPDIMEEALDHIENWRYFTVSAPRQSGKTTLLRDIVEKIKDKYLTIFISFESYGEKDKEDFIETLVMDIIDDIEYRYNEKIELQIPKNIDNIRILLKELYKKFGREIILMIDEFERLNEEIINEFLHVIRSVYHKKEIYKLRSVVLISVSYLSGILEDNASPFNIAEHMEVPYFTKEQVYDLLSQHEKETGQLFDEKVKELIWHNAAGQPGLTNGLAYDLVAKKAKGKKIITEKHFEKTLYDYIKKYIDKNMENIISKAHEEKEIVMQILFEPESVEFDISDERIKFLYLHGVIDDCEGKCCVKVPLYYKKLYNHFKPKINGEKDYIINIYENLSKYFTKEGKLKINELMKKYIEYINKRGAVMFKGKKLYEGVYQYNLDIFLSTYMEELGGEVLTEVEVGGGRIDLLVRYKEEKYLIEIKRNPGPRKFQLAKKQLVEYLKRSGLKEGWLVIYSEAIEDFKHEIEEIDGVKINVWFIKTNFESPSKVN
ncbi:ATP-dependent transcriptional regulator [Marinitoga piezophila KA3]|uniref:ATP-dependent transcriptional regulator n=1 Tax=Marinitoga piezophila (strain DSM 14283 / JCM 11233 / KA3) TaxID=443254 RepID=H2J7E6_MARPK|nr:MULTISPECIES: AAA-like domain-containing protein [Marinitoga]AEX85338.1 ATP-dependent transcriptional regulator [Marinitoga piezophila KA3]APT75820.1 transcriptional regulator [Marinitoga sp. 1137]